jgi:hypothetical protein
MPGARFDGIGEEVAFEFAYRLLFDNAIRGQVPFAESAILGDLRLRLERRKAGGN